MLLSSRGNASVRRAACPLGRMILKNFISKRSKIQISINENTVVLTAISFLPTEPSSLILRSPSWF